jgi:hypothetical protein
MCEKCEARRTRNTEIKRAAMDLLFADPARPELYEWAETTPGYLSCLALCRQMERVSRAPMVNGEPDPEEVALIRRKLLDITAEERTAVLRILEYIVDMASGVRLNVGQAKLDQRDTDVATVAAVIKDGAIVVLVNGEEVQRIELAGREEGEVLDAAERAMQAHRAEHGEVG